MKIQESVRYEMFVVNNVNRDVKKTKHLELSMRRHGFIDAYPLHVVIGNGGRLIIKAGHHRFHVASKLGIPVKYVVCTDGAEIHELERATNHWSIDDYLASFSRQGIADYLEVKAFSEETGIRASQCISIFRGETGMSGNGMSPFKAGRFQVKTRIFADRLKPIVKTCKEYGVQCATSKLFIQAVLEMFVLEEFSDFVFIQKIKSHAHLFSKKALLVDYEQMIEDVYNRQNKKKVNLAFLARTMAKERQQTFGRSLEIDDLKRTMSSCLETKTDIPPQPTSSYLPRKMKQKANMGARI